MKSEEGSHHSQAHSQAEEADFEPYDPVRWETAAEETTSDEAQNEEGVGAPDATEDVQEESSKSSKPAPTVSTSKPEYVRALKDSEGRRPYFKKGDILRVINKTSRRNLDSELERTYKEILAEAYVLICNQTSISSCSLSSLPANLDQR